jgi:hypothetical protein
MSTLFVHGLEIERPDFTVSEPHVHPRPEDIVETDANDGIAFCSDGRVYMMPDDERRHAFDGGLERAREAQQAFARKNAPYAGSALMVGSTCELPPQLTADA